MDLCTMVKDPSVELVDVVEGWSSLIWTERYLLNGEFQLQTAKIEETMKLLPLKTLLTLRDTKEIMRVETHSISVNDDGIPVLTVSGRSFETFFEDRANIDSNAPYGSTDDGGWDTGVDNWLTLAADILGAGLAPSGSGLPVYDRISNYTVVNMSSIAEFDNYLVHVDPDTAYSSAQKILASTDVGIKNDRTAMYSGAQIATILYEGLDRTINQTDNAQMVLDYASGHIQEPSYLWTVQGEKNIAYVRGHDYFLIVAAPGVATTIADLDRRVLLVDADDITGTDSTAQAALLSRGLGELATNKSQNVFTGKASPNIPYVYNVDYALGDIATCRLGYGVVQDMRVTEFIRTETVAGETGYPTLTTIV